MAVASAAGVSAAQSEAGQPNHAAAINKVNDYRAGFGEHKLLTMDLSAV